MTLHADLVGAHCLMEDRITGSWPGGPQRRDDEPRPMRVPHLPRAEQIEAGIASRSLRRRRRSRSLRVVIGLALSLVVSGGIGWALGLRSHSTAAELSEDTAARRRNADISREVNRTLLELWKMEDVEALRNRGLTR